MTKDIHNHYETLLLEEMTNRGLENRFSEDTLSDITCTSLNRLPSKYVRSEVDLYFFQSQDERDEMAEAVNRALDFAVDQVARRTNLS